MISYLRGKVVSQSGNIITIDVNGVGYEVACSQGALSKVKPGGEISLIVYTDIKETSIELFGFEDSLEKEVFLLLKRVKGVGSKLASEIVSQIRKLELLRVIGAGDVARLNSVKGIGKKTAELIILELKERVAEFALSSGGHRKEVDVLSGEPYNDALEALKALGFSERDAERALGKVKSMGANGEVQTGDLVKAALKYV